MNLEDVSCPSEHHLPPSLLSPAPPHSTPALLWSERMKTHNIRTLTLILSVVFYLLIGAAVFHALETESESSRKKVLEQQLSQLRTKYGLMEEDYKQMERVILQSEQHRGGRQWKFTGSFYFAITVITTIGEENRLYSSYYNNYIYSTQSRGEAVTLKLTVKKTPQSLSFTPL